MTAENREQYITLFTQIHQLARQNGDPAVATIASAVNVELCGSEQEIDVFALLVGKFMQAKYPQKLTRP